MRSLGLRFAGPLQAWGTTPFKERITSDLPTWSGVVGLLACGLGAPRGTTPPWLSEVEVVIRVDRKGSRIRDFHTVNPPSERVALARGRMAVVEGFAKRVKPIKHVIHLADGSASHGTEVTKRHYLADAVFTVAISHGDNARVAELEAAMRTPKFMTYLGRKSCPPAFPFVLGVVDAAPVETVAQLPFLDALPGAKVPYFRVLPQDQRERLGALDAPGEAAS